MCRLGVMDYMVKRGIGGHHSAKAATIHWLTPPWILQSLGRFDLDPCAAPYPRPWDTATEMWDSDGLSRPWHDRVWCNPPYGSQLGAWLQRLAEHGNGVALVFARTEIKAFHEHVWPRAHAALFLRGRLTFYRLDGCLAQGNAGGPSVLIAYGQSNADALSRSGLAGHTVQIRS